MQDVPDSQSFAAVELGRQRLELYLADRVEANRVAPKLKKSKKEQDYSSGLFALCGCLPIVVLSFGCYYGDICYRQKYLFRLPRKGPGVPVAYIGVYTLTHNPEGLQTCSEKQPRTALCKLKPCPLRLIWPMPETPFRNLLRSTNALIKQASSYRISSQANTPIYPSVFRVLDACNTPVYIYIYIYIYICVHIYIYIAL